MQIISQRKAREILKANLARIGCPSVRAAMLWIREVNPVNIAPGRFLTFYRGKYRIDS
jgi:hypothetical protein